MSREMSTDAQQHRVYNCGCSQIHAFTLFHFLIRACSYQRTRTHRYTHMLKDGFSTLSLLHTHLYTFCSFGGWSNRITYPFDSSDGRRYSHSLACSCALSFSALCVSVSVHVRCVPLLPSAQRICERVKQPTKVIIIIALSPLPHHFVSPSKDDDEEKEQEP